jgi:16S rRNA (guanine966-N2)-methyltransferase
LRRNIAALGENDRTRVVIGDATRPPPALVACDLAFLDPPYASGLATPALAALAAAYWLTQDALIVVEIAAREPFISPEGFAAIDDRVYGAARLVFLRREDDRSADPPPKPGSL